MRRHAIHCPLLLYRAAEDVANSTAPLLGEGTSGGHRRHQPQKYLFTPQTCRLHPNGTFVYPTRSALSDHVTVKHASWYSSWGDCFIPISAFETEAKRRKVRAGRQHWRFRHDQTVEHPNDVQESVQRASRRASWVLSPLEVRRRHPHQHECMCATAGGNGAKAMLKTIPKVVGMLGADLKITTVDGGKRRVELGEISRSSSGLLSRVAQPDPRKCLHAPSSPHVLPQVIITC